MKIPFSVLPTSILEKLSKHFLGIGGSLKPFFPFLDLGLKRVKSKYDDVHYLAMCFTASIAFFIVFMILSNAIMYYIGVDKFYIIALVVITPLTLFVFLQQTLYPKLFSARTVKDIERNILPALRAILIHLSSGVSLYEVLVSISNGPYGELALEFKTVVKKINAGTPAVDALEESASKNPSLYYRRAIWQIVNGLKAGGDITLILKEIIDGLSKEQIIQIENYGSQLNPLAMFYMLIAVVIPSLAITLLVVLSSFLSSSGFIMKLMFFGLYIVILFFQIMFLGLIKTRRPNLIGT